MSKKHWTVKSKLSLAFGSLTVVILFVASLAIVELGMLHGKFESYVEGAGARAHLAADVESAALRRAVAVRNMVLSNDPAERAAENQRVLEAQADLEKHLQLLVALVKGAPGEAAKEQYLIADIQRIDAQYGEVAVKILAMAQEGRKDEAIASMSTHCRPLLDKLIQHVADYIEQSKQLASAQVDETEASYQFDRSLLLGICLLSLVFAGTTGYLITRNLLLTLGADPGVLGAAAERVAEGDLTPMREAAIAPAGSVLSLLGCMQANLANVVGQVRCASDSIATGTTQIAAGNADLSQRTEEQASSLEQTAASMEELSSTVKNNADTTQQANQMATAASQAASRGGEVVGQVIGTMDEIAQASKKIADIIGVIDGIAFQTNILALNAAVEAARAGEQGRGFAVVASEVRTLAQRSANAAKEIKALINDSVTKVDTGTRQVNEAGESMVAIVSQVKHVSMLIGEISRATGEQTNGILQVSDAVNLLDQVTQQNAALVEESAAAADSLRQQTVRLQDVVATFKLGNEPVLNAAPSQSVVSRQAKPKLHLSKAAKATRAEPKAAATAVHALADAEWDTF